MHYVKICIDVRGLQGLAYQKYVGVIIVDNQDVMPPHAFGVRQGG